MRAGHADQDEVTVLDKGHLVHQDLGRLLVRVIVAEGLEVVPAREPGRGGLHAGQIEWLAHPPHERLGKRAAPARELIQVTTRDGAMPRVETMGHGIDGQDVDVRRQRVVDPATDGLGR